MDFYLITNNDLHLNESPNSDLKDIYELFKFDCTRGYVLFFTDKFIFFTDSRYTLAAKKFFKKSCEIYNLSETTIVDYLIMQNKKLSGTLDSKVISVKEFRKIIKKKNMKVGLMFGPEASGLSNQDLSFANYILQIPTSSKFKSLNLSHSLTIICYEIFKVFNEKKIQKKSSDLKISCNYYCEEKIVSQKFFLEKMGIIERAKILEKSMTFKQKDYMSLTLMRLLNKELMGGLFKVIFAFKSKNKNFLGFR